MMFRCKRCSKLIDVIDLELYNTAYKDKPMCAACLKDIKQDTMTEDEIIVLKREELLIDLNK